MESKLDEAAGAFAASFVIMRRTQVRNKGLGGHATDRPGGFLPKIEVRAPGLIRAELSPEARVSNLGKPWEKIHKMQSWEARSGRLARSACLCGCL